MGERASEAGASFLELIDGISTWRRAGVRAPHKPLLMLFAMGRLAQGQVDVPFADCRRELIDLLHTFGPPRASYHPEYPFWWLQSDGLWEVEHHGPLRRRSRVKEPTPAALTAAGAIGRIPANIQRLLRSDDEILAAAVQRLLTTHFPISLHTEIRTAVGLGDLPSLPRAGRALTGFRNSVLLAYRFACAVCGFSLRLDNKSIGLDAAHIRWRQAKGPDTAVNGLALCSIHHKLFDLGAFTLSDDMRVLVSERVTDDQRDHHRQQVLLMHHGRAVAAPVRSDQKPHCGFVVWHRREVFREAPLPL